MGLTGALARVAENDCPQCKQKYGKHSKKNFMRCLYTANYNLYNILIELDALKQSNNTIPEEDKSMNSGRL